MNLAVEKPRGIIKTGDKNSIIKNVGDFLINNKEYKVFNFLDYYDLKGGEREEFPFLIYPKKGEQPKMLFEGYPEIC